MVFDHLARPGFRRVGANDHHLVVHRHADLGVGVGGRILHHLAHSAHLGMIHGTHLAVVHALHLAVINGRGRLGSNRHRDE